MERSESYAEGDEMRKTVLGMGVGVAGCTLVGLLLGFLPWPHSLPSVSRPLCRSIQESSLPMSSVAQDSARPAMPSAVFRLQLDDADSSAGTFLQPVPTRLSQLPFPLIRELLKEPLRPLAFSGPSESGTRLVRSLPELLAASPRISAWMENERNLPVCSCARELLILRRCPVLRWSRALQARAWLSVLYAIMTSSIDLLRAMALIRRLYSPSCRWKAVSIRTR